MIMKYSISSVGAIELTGAGVLVFLGGYWFL